MILSEPDMQLADLGLHQHVPHVMLHFEYDTDQILPAWSWQSLDVSGANRVDVVFSDLGASCLAPKKSCLSLHIYGMRGQPCISLSLGLQCYECTAITSEHEDGFEQVFHRISIGRLQRTHHATRHLVEEEDFWRKQNMHSRVFEK